MFEVTVESDFAAAHRLRDYEGVCERLHGHNYKVAVTVRGETLGSSGMLADFKTLKGTLVEVLDRLDHRCLNDDVDEFKEGALNPTAENIAKMIWGEMAERLGDALPDGATVARVTVWESERSAATYAPDKG